jgi:hypothetical protein
MELKKLSDVEINEAYKFQHDKNHWTFFEEREFMENLLQTRFNFLITVYALFINAYFMAQGSELIVLILGLLITILLWIPIYRIYKKVDIVLTILHKLEDKHTTLMIAKEIGKSKIFPKGVNYFIGIFIPLVLVLSFVAGIIFYIYKCKA